MDLPEPVASALRPLFDRLPLEQAMPTLVVREGAAPDHIQAVQQAISESEEILQCPALVAGLWLYIDELDRSHTISQDLKDATGSFWHGIMHRREGDFSNSHYWFRKAGVHPAMRNIPDYDAHAFIDEVEQQHADNPAPLLDRQRREWAALFAWCAQQHR